MAIVRDGRAVALESVYVQVARANKWSGCRTAPPWHKTFSTRTTVTYKLDDVGDVHQIAQGEGNRATR